MSLLWCLYLLESISVIVRVHTQENDQVRVYGVSKNGHIRWETRAREVKIKAGIPPLEWGESQYTISLLTTTLHQSTSHSGRNTVFMKESYNTIGKLKRKHPHSCLCSVVAQSGYL